MKPENFEKEVSEPVESGFDAVNDGGELFLCDKLVGACETLDMYMERPEEPEAPEAAELSEDEREWTQAQEASGGNVSFKGRPNGVCISGSVVCTGCAGALLGSTQVCRGGSCLSGLHT